MSKTIRADKFANDYFAILDEAFVKHHGIFLDRNTSLFETLETITPAEASRPVGGKCATLAAQVTHVTFYLEVLEDYVLRRKRGSVDWGEIWRTVGAVTPEEWDALRENLKKTYNRVKKELRGLDWQDTRAIGGALAILVHTAYHLGEIRQALCTLK
ncbi:MAG: hypothetical protein AB1750_13145 [Chloroflexota bacterium]